MKDILKLVLQPEFKFTEINIVAIHSSLMCGIDGNGLNLHTV
jgi:hypothetical protein